MCCEQGLGAARRERRTRSELEGWSRSCFWRHGRANPSLLSLGVHLQSVSHWRTLFHLPACFDHLSCYQVLLVLFGISLVQRDQALRAYDKGYDLERQAVSYCKKSRFFTVNMWKFFAKNTVWKNKLMETRSKNDWANIVHRKIKNTQQKKDRSFVSYYALIWNILIVNTITVCVFPEVCKILASLFFSFFAFPYASWFWTLPQKKPLIMKKIGVTISMAGLKWGIFRIFPGRKGMVGVIFLNQVVLDTWKLCFRYWLLCK